MPEPYIAEVQTGRWTSDGVRESFKKAGFEIRDFPITQHLEKQVPADQLFFAPAFSKVFGLQYKTLYHNGGDSWPLDKEQHKTLRNRSWIFYCCSELRDVNDHSQALHFARFYRPGFEFLSSLSAKGPFHGGRPYMRWGAFYQGLKACKIGVRVRSQPDLINLLKPVTGPARNREVRHISEVFLADYERRVLFSERSFE